MGYAFISYSTKNQKEADAMRELFRKNGIDTWMAPYDIPVGSRYAQVVNQALKNCACLVLLLTNDAQKSIWVGKEVERAVSCRKTILPLQLEDIKLNDEFELYISTDQIMAIPKIDEDRPEIQTVLQAVSVYTGSGGAAPRQTAALQPEKVKRPTIKKPFKISGRLKRWLIAVGIVIAAIALFFFYMDVIR